MTVRLRDYRPADIGEIVDLFRATVRGVNRRDYSAAQVEAWAPARIDVRAWTARLEASYTAVAQQGRPIVGFANLTDEGVVDLLYVHRDHQGEGIASAMLGRLEDEAARRGLSRLVTEASLTARPFFARRGFRVVTPQVVARAGQTFDNFLMEKHLNEAGGL